MKRNSSLPNAFFQNQEQKKSVSASDARNSWTDGNQLLPCHRNKKTNKIPYSNSRKNYSYLNCFPPIYAGYYQCPSYSTCHIFCAAFTVQFLLFCCFFSNFWCACTNIMFIISPAHFIPPSPSSSTLPSFTQTSATHQFVAKTVLEIRRGFFGRRQRGTKSWQK